MLSLVVDYNNNNDRATHALSCRLAIRRTDCHHEVNNLGWRALSKANVPSVKEPFNGSLNLVRDDGKCPDGSTLIPWLVSKAM